MTNEAKITRESEWKVKQTEIYANRLLLKNRSYVVRDVEPSETIVVLAKDGRTDSWSPLKEDDLAHEVYLSRWDFARLFYPVSPHDPMCEDDGRCGSCDIEFRACDSGRTECSAPKFDRDDLLGLPRCVESAESAVAKLPPFKFVRRGRLTHAPDVNVVTDRGDD